MRIFALETNIQDVKKRFLANGEEEIFTVSPHIMSFAVRILWDIILTVVLLCIAVYVYRIDLVSGSTAMTFFCISWFLLVFFSLIEAYIDWGYDFVLLTTDTLIIVDQISLFRRTLTPIHLENLEIAVAQTQWLNLFDFGIIHFAFKEGGASEIDLRFIPKAGLVAEKISRQLMTRPRKNNSAIPSRSTDNVR